MPLVTETSSKTLRTVSSHKISFRGIAGVIFWSILWGLLVFILALATEGWIYMEVPSHLLDFNNHTMRTLKVGLFQTCLCSDEMEQFFQREVWFIVSKILFVVAMICVAITMVVTILYMFIHKANKDKTLRSGMVTAFIAVILLAMGLFTVGLKTSHYAAAHSYDVHHSYSFVFAVASGVLIMVSGFASIIQCIRARSRSST